MSAAHVTTKAMQMPVVWLPPGAMLMSEGRTDLPLPFIVQCMVGASSDLGLGKLVLPLARVVWVS